MRVSIVNGKHLAALLAAVVAVALVHAGCQASGVEPVNTVAGGPALKGFDAVAYFQEGRAVEGRAEFAHEWQGARWLFASAESRDLFAREPERYAPQYGGYCSWAVSHGYTAEGDPRAWKVVGGKLYLNYNAKVQEMWEQDIPGFIAQGDRNWPGFLRQRPEHKGR